MREEPGARRTGLSRDQIGARAVEIADADGFDAVSMRNVARELDAGTMTLYHYVRNKDELLTLMGDTIMGELILPDDELSGDWRKDLSSLARATRDVFKRHPWIYEAMSEPVGSGPNGLRHFEQSMAAAAELRVPQRDRIELITLIDDFVFGFTLREVLQEMYEAAGDPDMTESGLAFLEAQLRSGGYPHMEKMFRGDVRAGIERMMESFSGERANDRRFERGLKALLDGFEPRVKKRKRQRD
jgi:AcrR family transcriptional regulator